MLEQRADREREAAQLKNELRERDALLADTEARAAQSDARVAELEGVLAEKEEAAAAAARRIAELEADTAAKAMTGCEAVGNSAAESHVDRSLVDGGHLLALFEEEGRLVEIGHE